MEPTNTPKRPAKRRVDAAAKNSRKVESGRSVWVDKEAAQMAEQASVNLGITKGAYASAAIRYFVDKGLDPTKAQGVGMAEMTEKLSELSLKIDTLQDGARKQSADIGNRLVGIWRTLERNLYTHLGGEQDALYLYLERIEENLLSKISATESQYLWPTMERVLRGGTDSMLSRKMASDLLQFIRVIVAEDKAPRSQRMALHSEQDELRDADVVRQSRELLDGLKLTERSKSIRPSITSPPNSAIPQKAPAPATTPPVKP